MTKVSIQASPRGQGLTNVGVVQAPTTNQPEWLIVKRDRKRKRPRKPDPPGENNQNNEHLAAMASHKDKVSPLDRNGDDWLMELDNLVEEVGFMDFNNEPPIEDDLAQYYDSLKEANTAIYTRRTKARKLFHSPTTAFTVHPHMDEQFDNASEHVPKVVTVDDEDSSIDSEVEPPESWYDPIHIDEDAYAMTLLREKGRTFERRDDGCFRLLPRIEEIPIFSDLNEDDDLSSLQHEPAEADLRREEERIRLLERERLEEQEKLDQIKRDRILERNELARAAVNTQPGVSRSGLPDFDELIRSFTKENSNLLNSETDQWMSYLENIVILGYNIANSNSFTDIFVAVVGYIKMHTQKSVVQEILKVIDGITTKIPAENVQPHMWEAKDVLQKWDLFKTNTVFMKISYLISAAMSLTVCSIKEIKWSPFGLELVAIEAAKSQLKAYDVVDAILGTFTWMAETGYRVFQERSLMPLLYSDNAMQKFNEECDYIMAHSDQILAGNGGCVEDFSKKVDDVLSQVTKLKSVKDSGPTAVWLQQRYSELIDIQYKIVGKYKNTAIRFCPFGIGITGPSGVGKSTLAKIMMKTSLTAMGFDPDPRRIITKDMFDKYDSTYTSDVLGTYLDDVGNGKAEFAQVAFTDVLIKFFNNMNAQAVKAELNAKGVVFISFKCGIITSNFEDYTVRHYSNKPESILRRFIHIRTSIKPEFRVPGGISLDVANPNLLDDDLCKDVWELSIEECFLYETSTGKESYVFRVMDVELEDGRTVHCKNLDLDTCMDCVVQLAKNHKRRQESVVSRSEAFDAMPMCATCCKPVPMCRCVKKIVPHSLDQIGEVIVKAAQRSAVGYFNSWFKPAHLFNTVIGFKPIKMLSTWQLSREMKHVIDGATTPWLVALTPRFVFETSVFQRSVNAWQHSAAIYDLKWPMRIGVALGTSAMGAFWYADRKDLCACTGWATWLGTMSAWSHYKSRLAHYQTEYLRRRDALPVCAKEARDSYAVTGALAIASLVVGLKMYQLWHRSKIEAVPNSLLNREEIDGSPGWFGFMMSRLGVRVEVSESSKRSTTSQVVSTLEKSNLFWAEFERPDGKITGCNIFFPRKSVAWFPEHVFYPDGDFTKVPHSSLTITVHRHSGPGGKFTFKTQLQFCSKLPGGDMVCAFVPNCPDLRDKMKWLPLKVPSSGISLCQFVRQTKDGIVSERVQVTHGQYGHVHRPNMVGGCYTTANAKLGACMSPLVIEQKEPSIVGFHIGGSDPDSYGVMQTVTFDQAQKMISDLEAIPGVCISSMSTELPAQQYGRKLLESLTVHPHSMTARLKETDYIDVLGSTRLRTVQKSRVRPSVISEHVRKVTGVPNTWSGPQLEPNWRAFNETLEHIVDPSDMFLPSELERARMDWMCPLRDAMSKHCGLEDFRPLTDSEAIVGVPSVRFLDPLKMSTGMGFPVFGAKRKWFSELADGTREPHEAVLTELKRMYDCWDRGERAYPVFTATLKDEPTTIGKTKVRVFQASAVAFSLHVRKYFLPIARFLSLYPLLSESAVGVNAFSKDWEELMAHAHKYSDDKKVIAWDYAKYDVRMNSQITRAVLTCFVELAEIGGYDEQSLRIMKNMIVDIAHPLMDYNGSMIMAYNMNTSGNNITVNINGTAGSLYVRLGFFHVYPEASNFRDHVSAMTYGDDFVGSVAPEWRKFDFCVYKEFLAAHKMKITPPNKSEDESPFMDQGEADFLKRKSTYIPEIGTSIGSLDENSIFKSLHANVQSKTELPISVSASCIESAMHEWFAHGREVYEKRAGQMKEVCRLANLPVPAVNATFDERVAEWHEKYSS